MIKFVTEEDRRRILLEKLINETPSDKRCSFLKIDDIGAYCSKGIKGKGFVEIKEKRRWACDIYSLQLWCLDKKRAAEKCIFYNGERLD
jgi:hypothetical protein